MPSETKTPPSTDGAREVRSGDRPRLVVGITGASGVVYGIRMLEALLGLPVETHLVMSKSAER